MEIRERLGPVLEIASAEAAAADQEARFPTATVQALRESGLLGLTVDADAGGLGAGPADFADVTSRLAASCGSTAMVYMMHVCASMVVAAGNPPGAPEAVSELAAGHSLGTLAFSERGSRSHFWAPVSRAIPETADTVHVKASKGWVTSAGHAQVYVLSCLAPDEQHATDTNLYLVRDTDIGLTVSSPWRGLGLRGNASSPMEVDAILGEDHRLGARGDGFRLMMEVVLPWFNLGSAAVSVGLARSALDAAAAHAATARFEHLGTTLSDLPTIRARLARAAIAVDMVTAYLQDTARRVGAADPEVMLAVLGVKAAANEMALDVTDEAMRVCGGSAFSAHLPIERAFRDARAGHVMAPTADALYDFCGRALCGLDLF